MKPTLWGCIILFFISCSKEESNDPPRIFDESILTGTWQIESVERFESSTKIDLSHKIDHCEETEQIHVYTTDRVIWTSYFPWNDEETTFCHERSETMKIRAIENQILVDDFNSETIITGEIIDENEIIIYRFHNLNPEIRLKFSFRK